MISFILYWILNIVLLNLNLFISFELKIIIKQFLRHGLELRTNLDMVMKYLKSLGYIVAIHKLVASEFGLPQRRCRIYFFGMRKVNATRMDGPNDVIQRIPKILRCLEREPDHAPATASALCIPFVSCTTFTVEDVPAKSCNSKFQWQCAWACAFALSTHFFSWCIVCSFGLFVDSSFVHSVVWVMMKADLMYPDDHPRVLAELQRLTKRREPQNPEGEEKKEKGGKWSEVHASLAESCCLACFSPSPWRVGVAFVFWLITHDFIFLRPLAASQWNCWSLKSRTVAVTVKGNVMKSHEIDYTNYKVSERVAAAHHQTTELHPT